MPSAILLSNVAAEIVGTPVKLFSPVTVTLQFSPKRDGFSAFVVVEVAMVENIGPGYLWYSLPTIGLYPWFSAAELAFTGHTDVVAFNLGLDPGILWIRASVIEYSRGTVSAYVAH